MEMVIQSTKLTPGDRVVITQNAWGHHDDIWFWLEATEGSTAVIISLEEYQDFIATWKGEVLKEPPEQVQQWMERGEQYPVRFETVAPANVIDMPYEWMACEVGYVTVLDVRFIRKAR